MRWHLVVQIKGRGFYVRRWRAGVWLLPEDRYGAYFERESL